MARLLSIVSIVLGTIIIVLYISLSVRGNPCLLLPSAQPQQEPPLAPSSSPGDRIDLPPANPHLIPRLNVVGTDSAWFGHHQLHIHIKTTSENGLLPVET